MALRRATSTTAAIVLALAACRTAPPQQPASEHAIAASPLRIMTFNIRLDLASDGPNAWPYRRDWVASLIRFHGADAVGVQEALAHMLTELDARLPGFARVGVGRADGRAGGEFSPILYHTGRLELLDHGTFWLSPSPEVAGSKGWDAAIERVATWARFRDRRSGCTHLHLNTHFDHIGEQARQESARLIRTRLASLAGDLAVIVTADLNADPRSVPYRIFTRDTIAGGIGPLLDAFDASSSGHYGPTSSWNAFKAIEAGRRIDYVLVSPGIPVLTHGILPDSWDNRFPSDHLPVLAAVGPTCR
jgi:endonuclease/exonuclease/phosphatase family metal-dependent hydrolase